MIVLLEAFVYLYFLGYPFTWIRSARKTWTVDIALTLAQGILFNYLVLLVFQKIPLSLRVGGVFALLGAAALLWDLYKKKLPALALKPVMLVAFFYITALCFIKIFSEPLSDWDALSIWFFHAKMIYTAGSIGMEAGWKHPSLYLMVAAYPKLVPSLAAELCYRQGLWNGYLPKTGLFVMMLPALLWIFSFFELALAFPALVLFFVFGMHQFLWIGYMDGFLALFGALGVLLLSRYRAENRSEDLYSSICALGIVASTKNEGLLYVVCFLGVAALFDWKSFRKVGVFKVVAAICAALLPAVAWGAFRVRNGIMDCDFDFGASGVFSRFFARLHDGVSVKFLANSLFFLNHSVRDSFLVLIGAIFSLRIFKVEISSDTKRSIRANLVLSAAYLSGLFATYMISVHEQHDLVLTSVDRCTMMAVWVLNVSIYLLMRDLARTFQPV